MLLQNITIYNQYLGRKSGGALGNEFNQLGFDASTNLSRFIGASGYSNVMYEGESVPRGYSATSSPYLISKIAGGMSTINEISGTSNFQSSLYAGRNISSTLSGWSTETYSINGFGNLTITTSGNSTFSSSIAAAVQVLVTLSGSSIFGGTGQAAAPISITLSGNGYITTGSILNGTVGISATVLGQSDITDAVLAGGYYIDSNISGSSTLSGNFANTPGWMHCTILVNEAGELTPANIASAVWNELAVSHTTPTTMGGKMNAAGTAGDPWGTALSGYPAGTAGNVLVKVDKNASLIPASL
jgi:hypothetical protein